MNFKKKINLSHLRTFGCEAYVYVPKKQRRKLDTKSKKMILVGYQSNSLNYRLFDPQNRQVTISRDMNFKERNQQEPSSIENEIIFPLHDTSDELDNEENKDENKNQEENSSKTLSCEQDKQRQLRDRSKLRKPERYETNLITFEEPTTYEEAVTNPNANMWIKAIEEQLAAHQKNKTWKIEEMPIGKTSTGFKWVSKLKNGTSGVPPRYKACLCAKSFSQKAGIDYNKIFALVVRYESICTLLAIAAQYNLEIAQFDVKTAFLNGELDEDIYMDVPEGVTVCNKGDKCKLLKSIYGLKQALTGQWNIKFDKFLKCFNFSPSSADPCVYCDFINNVFVFLALYVDDGLLMAKTKEALNEVPENLKNNFETHRCNSNTFAGIQIKQDRKNCEIILHQRDYIERILARFNMNEAKPVSVPIDSHSITLLMNSNNDECDKYPYREAIGSLIFLT